MRTRTTMVSTLIVTGILVGTPLISTLGYGAAPAVADSIDTVQFTIASGGLQSTVSAPNDLSRVVLGSGEQRSTGTAAPWTIIDVLGSGASWTLSASASDFTSAPGSAADEWGRERLP